MTITDEQIEQLMREAAVAGDTDMVDVCRQALAMSEPARQMCQDAIENALANTVTADDREIDT